jgi:hypothetical protein
MSAQEADISKAEGRDGDVPGKPVQPERYVYIISDVGVHIRMCGCTD